jgi:ankyrin repeat protein
MTVRRIVRAVGLVLACAASQAAAQELWYTLGIAASHNDTAQVTEMLFKGNQDPDGIESAGQRTPLEYAASFNNLAMAKLLLDHGAHVDARDPTGATALHWSAERGNLDFMRYLIDNKATLDIATKQGITPLMLAAGQGQAGAARLLVQSGADPKKQDYTGRDAFGWAAGKPPILQALSAKR